MTESEVEKALAQNNWKIIAVNLLISMPTISPEIRARANTVRDRLKKIEADLEQMGREIEIRKRIEQLEQLEMELGIYR